MKNIIKSITQKIADEKGLYLVNSITRGSNRNPSFEIYIDGKDAISADVCADFSRAIKGRLELTEFADIDYKLVVSSPGIDEPLIYLDQYYKHIDREFKISFNDGEKVQSIEARLKNIQDNILSYIYKDEELKIEFNKIKKAKVKLSF